MSAFTPVTASIGGALIGLAAVVLMGSLGRIAGISGIVGGLADKKDVTSASIQNPDDQHPGDHDHGDKGWRIAFLAGLIGVPAMIGMAQPEWLRSTVSLPLIWMAVAGLIVGLGVTFGNGCTSGHGVCGNARLSTRSLVATLTFMIVGIATTYIVRHIFEIGL
jgi:uncharacterized membrane protein YedE/YeeE